MAWQRPEPARMSAAASLAGAPERLLDTEIAQPHRSPRAMELFPANDKRASADVATAAIRLRGAKSGGWSVKIAAGQGAV